MYNAELEQLIESILADGEITETERRVLHAKATQYGVSIDEIDVYVDGKLHRMKNQRPRSQKHGDVAKCPQCGAPVPAGAVKCPDCDYEFRNVGANSSAVSLQERLDSVRAKYQAERKSVRDAAAAKRNSGQYIDTDKIDDREESVLEDIDEKECEELNQTIKEFPIPNDKESLLEFLTSTQPLLKDSNFGKAYKAKYEQAMNKANVSFAGDKMFKAFFENEQNKQKAKARKRKMIIGCVIAAVVVVMLIIFLPYIIYVSEDSSRNSSIKEYTTLIQEKKYTEALQLFSTDSNLKHINDEEKYNMLKMCVESLCEDGDIKKAHRIAVSESKTFSPYSIDYTPGRVEAMLEEIISTYDDNEKTEE